MFASGESGDEASARVESTQMPKHTTEPRFRRSKLREGGGESLDARVGGWTREQLLAMDAAYCEALRQALTRPAAARDLVAPRERE
jgi:hypothetical protein